MAGTPLTEHDEHDRNQTYATIRIYMRTSKGARNEGVIFVN